MCKPQIRPQTRDDLEKAQLTQLQVMLAEILPHNRFYGDKFRQAGCSAKVNSLKEFAATFPFTLKQELIEDQTAHPPYGTNLTYPRERYTRFNQTSATTSGIPLRWLDTPESWSWMLDNWEVIFRTAGVSAADRIFCAFSFGPFLGFWTAFEAATRMGSLAVPGGGLSSVARLQTLRDNHITVLCCTPTYAIRLGEVAREENIDLSAGKVRRIIVAGEPGGSIPAVYSRIEALWPGARVSDHHGMTEIGPVSYESPRQRGILRIIETGFIPEIIDPKTGQATPPGEIGELVLTNLGRWGSPLIRYRTGDLVRQMQPAADSGDDLNMALEGGILGRTDDMLTVRGVNVYPGAVENVLRQFSEVAEYRVEIRRVRDMEEMKVVVEPRGDDSDSNTLIESLQKALRGALALRIPVALVKSGSLPRFEMKAKRWVRLD